MIAAGIPAKKIVLGKVASVADAFNSGYIHPEILGTFA